MSAERDHESTYADISDLIIVCCHAVYTGQNSWISESDWLLQDFQKSNTATGKPGEHETFVAHVVTAAMAASSNASALLIFSGGRTSSHELSSEAAGYARVLSEINPAYQELGIRVQLEEYATDSLQNLLFSILRFHELTGRYPNQVTIITHAFKERRLLELHAPAIRWPPGRIRVQGINPPFSADELASATQGEQERAFKFFTEDPYGVRPPLSDKRVARRWSVEAIGSLTVDPDVKELLMWTGGDTGRAIYPGKLPW